MPNALPPPVRVQYTSLYQPDISVLAESFVPFGRWSEEHIAAQLPVVVSYPTEISQRLKVLEGYLAPGGWPRKVPRNAIETVHVIVEQMMPILEAEIARGVRLVAAAAIRDDGSRAIAVRNQALSSFLASQMLATARALYSYRLVGEAVLDWGAEFYDMRTVYSIRLIHGLSFLARQPHGWAGWTDADLWIEERGYRLFAPICPEPGDSIDADTLSPEEVHRLIIPQLLLSHPSFLTVRRLAFEPWATFKLVLRNGVFVDAETFTDHYNAKAYITRIAADRIVPYLQKIPLRERSRLFLEMNRSLYPLSEDIEERITTMLPFD